MVKGKTLFRLDFGTVNPTRYQNYLPDTDGSKITGTKSGLASGMFVGPSSLPPKRVILGMISLRHNALWVSGANKTIH